MNCPKCKKETEHYHRHDAPYGMVEAHMSGSERYECKECGTALYKQEGEKQGLRYILD